MGVAEIAESVIAASPNNPDWPLVDRIWIAAGTPQR